MKAVTARLRMFVADMASFRFDAMSGDMIALIFALGLVLGVFPVFGVPTLLCGVAAVAFRLNLPAIQLVNQVCSPLQYALLIPLGRAGARIVSASGAGAASNGPLYWKLADAARNVVVGWCCCCVPLGVLLYVILSFAFSRGRWACFNKLESPV